MEVLEAIRQRRTERVPFTMEMPPEEVMHALREIAAIAPGNDPIRWRLEQVHDEMKPALATIVREDFGDHFQKDSGRFRQVFSGYPPWLRFSDSARDGIRLAGLPKAARHFYRLALGRRFGPLFGKLGILNSEIGSYCRNIVANPALFGVFLDRHAAPAGIAAIIDAGSMLQNLRLAATALGLSYQDLGWITATKAASDRAGKLLGIPEQYAAVNFFRIGYREERHRRNKISDFRRSMSDIAHRERFGNPFRYDQPLRKTDMDVLDAIRGRTALRMQRMTEGDMAYLLEAARWAPTGFNVQPFEYLVSLQEDAVTMIVLENRERRDPDPGPCEALARGGVLQNIRLAARALGLEHRIAVLPAAKGPVLGSRPLAPRQYSAFAELTIGRAESPVE